MRMVRGTAVLLALGCLTGLSVQGLAGAPAVPALPSETAAVERFLADLEKTPVAYQARRRLEASSAKLNESAWMEAVTGYDPAVGFSYSIVAQGGSERIGRRVLKAVPEAEQENSTSAEWRKGNLSLENYAFDFRGLAGDGMLKLQLVPRSAIRAWSRFGAGDGEIGRSRSHRRTVIEIAVVLGSLGKSLPELFTNRRIDDACRR